MMKPIISKLILAVFTIVLSSTVAFSQSSEKISSSATTLKKPAYAEKNKARALAARSLVCSGRANMIIGEIRDLGAIHVVKVVDRLNKGALRNELFIRKDGAIMPVYGVPVNGRPTRERIKNADFGRRLAGIWLWRTGQKTLQVGSAQKTDLAYVVNLNPKEQPTVLANQLIVREDGFILPVGYGKTAIMRCIGCGGPGGEAGWGSFGWGNEITLPAFPTGPGGLSESWDHGWDTGGGATGWGWGWGSNWTSPPNQGNDACTGMTPEQCFCRKQCRIECKYADLESNCFENCLDVCEILPVPL